MKSNSKILRFRLIGIEMTLLIKPAVKVSIMGKRKFTQYTVSRGRVVRVQIDLVKERDVKIFRLFLLTAVILFILSVACSVAYSQENTEPKFIEEDTLAGVLSNWTRFGTTIFPDGNIQFFNHATAIKEKTTAKNGPCELLDSWVVAPDYDYVEQAVYQFNANTDTILQVTVLQGQGYERDIYDFLALADDTYDLCVEGEKQFRPTKTSVDNPNYFDYDLELGLVYTTAVEQGNRLVALSSLTYISAGDIIIWSVLYMSLDDIKSDDESLSDAVSDFLLVDDAILAETYGPAIRLQ